MDNYQGISILDIWCGLGSVEGTKMFDNPWQGQEIYWSIKHVKYMLKQWQILPTKLD